MTFQILQNSRKDIETRSIFQFSNKEIINFSNFITNSKELIQEQVDYEVQYLLSKSNRELVENKFINLFNEIKQSIQVVLKKRQDDEVIQSLKMVTKVQTDHNVDKRKFTYQVNQVNQQICQTNQSSDLSPYEKGMTIQKSNFNNNDAGNLTNIREDSLILRIMGKGKDKITVKKKLMEKLLNKAYHQLADSIRILIR